VTTAVRIVLCGCNGTYSLADDIQMGVRASSIAGYLVTRKTSTRKLSKRDCFVERVSQTSGDFISSFHQPSLAEHSGT
jgi:hypothetical protein